MQLIVNQEQRLAKMRAHTATHLLHAELAHIFPHTKQAWSYVDEDITRFDFHAKEWLNDQQLREIENTINTIIKKWLEVQTQELGYKEAIQLGAKAFFGDKYGDLVRVVTIKDTKTQKTISIELCGGTHVSNTAQIGAFKIISQEAVAAGIKRVTALTWPRIVEYTQQQEEELKVIAKKLGVQSTQIHSKIEKMIATQASTDNQLASLQYKYLATHIQNILQPLDKEGIHYYIVLPQEVATTLDFKDIVHFLKQEFKEKNCILYKQWWEYAIIGNNNWFSSKAFAQKHKLIGGWSDSLFQGKDEKVLKLQ